MYDYYKVVETSTEATATKNDNIHENKADKGKMMMVLQMSMPKSPRNPAGT